MTDLTLHPCAICGVPQPLALMNDHHIVPAAKGGSEEDDNFAHCCPACHNNAHRVADLIVNGKQDKADALIAIVYPKNPSRANLLHFVEIILKSEYRETPDRDGMLMIDLPPDAYKRLQTLAYDRRHANGRRLGVARYAQEVLLEHLKLKGLWPIQKESRPTIGDIVPDSLKNLTGAK